MQICLVGDFSGNPDEGMKKMARELYNVLSTHHNVYRFDISQIFSIKMWADLRKFNPQIIHYIPGPSIFSFIFLWILKRLNNSPRTIMSASHPKIKLGTYIIKFIRPDMILTQSNRTNIFFSNLNLKVRLIGNGADHDKFHPISNDQKLRLRKKYGFNNNSFIILHVGHMRQNRNMRFFYELKKNMECDIIIVSSTSTISDKKLEKDLKGIGCIVHNDYIEKIQEIYQLSDIYIFPTIHEENSIEIPLSILEALSCGLPVISTKFGGIEELLHEYDGIIIVNSIGDIRRNIDLIKNKRLEFAPLLTFDWKEIGKDLINIYREVQNK